METRGQWYGFSREKQRWNVVMQLLLQLVNGEHHQNDDRLWLWHERGRSQPTLPTWSADAYYNGEVALLSAAGYH